MDIELVTGISATLLILLVIQGLKGLGMPKKVSPIAAVLLGVLASLGYTYYADTVLWETVLVGVGVGLTAVGLYSGVKNTKEM